MDEANTYLCIDHNITYDATYNTTERSLEVIYVLGSRYPVLLNSVHFLIISITTIFVMPKLHRDIKYSV